MHIERRTMGVMVLLACLLVLASAACITDDGPTMAQTNRVPNGDVNRGRTAIESYGCGSCHTIPGVHDANALVAPPLIGYGRRMFVAGNMANTPDNLIAWILDPSAIEPGTGMPDLDVTESDARDIAAYLEALR